MKYKVIAKAPTAYQTSSLAQFGMGIKQKMDGSIYAEEIFDTEEEAKEFLKFQAQAYYGDDAKEWLDNIDAGGGVVIDGAGASIEVADFTAINQKAKDEFVRILRRIADNISDVPNDDVDMVAWLKEQAWELEDAIWDEVEDEIKYAKQ
jgi:hypothetical protein